MIPRLVKCLGVDANTLFDLATESDWRTVVGYESDLKGYPHQIEG